jgi:hypothetical protein
MTLINGSGKHSDASSIGTTADPVTWHIAYLPGFSLFGKPGRVTALASKTPVQAMKNRQKFKPRLVKTLPYYLPHCDQLTLIAPPY